MRTLADIEHGVRKASSGTYAMLAIKLAWAPGSIDTILTDGEPKECVVELRRPRGLAVSTSQIPDPAPDAVRRAVRPRHSSGGYEVGFGPRSADSK